MATQLDVFGGVTGDLAMKTPVDAATTANITLSGEQTLDGIALVAGDRALVQDQTAAEDNGIYTVSAGDWVRAPDWNGARDVVAGTSVLVNQGSVGEGRLHRVSTTGDITIGVTEVVIESVPFGSDGATGLTGATGPQGIAGPTGPVGGSGITGTGWTELLAEVDLDGLHSQVVGVDPSYNDIIAVMRVIPETSNSRIHLTCSDDGGVTYETTGYHDGSDPAATRLKPFYTDIDTVDDYFFIIDIKRLATAIVMAGTSGESSSSTASTKAGIFDNGNDVDFLKFSLFDSAGSIARNFDTNSTLTVYGR